MSKNYYFILCTTEEQWQLNIVIQLPIWVQQENDCSPSLHQWPPGMQASRGEMTLMHKGNTKDIWSQAKSAQGRLDPQHQQRKTLWCESNQPQEPPPSQEHPSRPPYTRAPNPHANPQARGPPTKMPGPQQISCYGSFCLFIFKCWCMHSIDHKDSYEVIQNLQYLS